MLLTPPELVAPERRDAAAASKPHCALRASAGALLVVLALSGCGGKPAPLNSTAQLRVAGLAELPPPDNSDTLEPERSFVIGPLDKLEIEVFGIDELAKKQIQTDPSGRISFPLAGTLVAAGKTSNELAAEIAARLRRAHVRNPQVAVNVIDAVSQTVTVTGEVKLPGQYPVSGRSTLLRAIAAAQGTGEFANSEDVVIFRTVKSQRMAALYSLKAIRAGTYGDPEIYPRDIVMVGNSAARQRFRDILQVSSLLSTPLVVLIQKF